VSGPPSISQKSAIELSDNRLLEGTARGWRDAQPSWPLLVMQQSNSANPLLLVDEIDKAIASRNGDVKATLLAMLEAENVRRALYWREADGPPPRRTVRERFNEMRSRTEKVRKAVSLGDAALLELRRHGLVLLVTTRPETFIPLPAGMVKPHPFSAVVRASRFA
jgi:hypothetical protein